MKIVGKILLLFVLMTIIGLGLQYVYEVNYAPDTARLAVKALNGGDQAYQNLRQSETIKNGLYTAYCCVSLVLVILLFWGEIKQVLAKLKGAKQA